MRIMLIPRMPPVMTTHLLGDIATATRIESTAKTTSVSSTRTDRGPEGAQAEPRRGRPDGPPFFRPAGGEEVRVREVQQVRAADELHPGEGHQVHGREDGEDPESKRAQDAVAKRLVLLAARETEDQDRQDEGIVGAQEALEEHQEADRDEIRDVNVHAGPASGLTQIVSMPILGSTQPMPIDHDLYFISMAARLLDMHPQTLRKYERLGLVRPTRTMGSMRLYSENELERLRLIKHLVEEAGVNLAGVQRLLTIAEAVQRIRPLMNEEPSRPEVRRRMAQELKRIAEMAGL